MKERLAAVSLVVLIFLGVLMTSGCDRFVPVPSSPALPSTPIPDCSFVPVSISAPLKSGNFVIHNQTDWQNFLGCVSGCPTPPVDLTQQMLLATAETFSEICPCDPMSEAVTSVCNDGNKITVQVLTSGPAMPSACQPVTFNPCFPVFPIYYCAQAFHGIAAGAAVSPSNLPVEWIVNGNNITNPPTYTWNLTPVLTPMATFIVLNCSTPTPTPTP